MGFRLLTVVKSRLLHLCLTICEPFTYAATYFTMIYNNPGDKALDGLANFSTAENKQNMRVVI